MISYSIVIPANNEGEFLNKTLASVVLQYRLPLELIVVNDNSTDNTEAIIDDYVNKYDFIKKINNYSCKEHKPGAKVVRAFYKGYDALKSKPDVIVKLDADIILPTDYFEIVCQNFENDKSLGIVGGRLHIENNDALIIEMISDINHVRGPIKAYRSTCFEEIGGIKESLGWDTVDVLLARYYKWDIKVLPELKVLHMRKTGSSYDSKNQIKRGIVFYRLRYGVIIGAIAIIKIAFIEKSINTFFNYFYGFTLAIFSDESFLVSEDEGKFIRNYRIKNIKSKLKKILKSIIFFRK